MVFDFTGGNDGGFSAAEPIASSPWTFSGSNWQVAAGVTMNRTLLSPTFVASGGPITVTFTHVTNFEAGFDGGILAWQVIGSPSAQVTNFTQDGYNLGSIFAAFPSTGSGAPGFSSNASFQSIADLGNVAAGTEFILRFEAAWDSSVIQAPPNWLITNVTVSGVETPDVAIPEPGTTVMLFLGGLAMVAIRYRCRR
jgi:hypothetical protein